ncbi:putative proteasome subunit alpha type 6 [Golovinomyces cichoracearum]|uniref:Putative proteasome subunit alpha type 6 n=1 Tax=Golovinomyces cichoracearum TaxID=62708 RepID=A0A420J5U6_9PEZI|nr:putative proteasome subunit alpha type 6 [Golovinomyces cichoracearum]
MKRKAKKVKRHKSGNSAEIPEKLESKVTRQNKTTPPFLNYLREYHESRETWKFKKNHQTNLLQHVLDVNVVPSSHAHLVYAYIRGLKGQVRTRLRDKVLAVKVKDQEDGAAGFSSNMPNQEQRQKEYEAAIVNYINTNSISDVRKSGHEEQFLLGSRDELIKDRIVKRIRAEMIINELASCSEPDESTQRTEKHLNLEEKQPIESRCMV